MEENKEERMEEYYYFIHRFIQEVFIKYLLFVKLDVRCWDYGHKVKQGSDPEQSSWWNTHENNHYNTVADML